MFFRPDVKFTTADSYIKNKMYFYCKVDSTYASKTRVHLQLTDFRVDSLMSTTTNVLYYLEDGGPALYGRGLNSLGSNKLYITLANVAVNPTAVRNIGIYDSSTSNHLYFDTPIEFDAATMMPGSSRYFSFTQQRTGTVSLITHVRGNWTMANGSKLTNESGLGWVWLSGGSGAGNNTGSKTYYEMNSSTLVSDAVANNAWSGDVFVYYGTHVINAPHAFKTNNSAFFNLGGASGGSTIVSNNILLATSGNNVSGKIRLTGGDAVTNALGTNRMWGTVGLEGTGAVTFSVLLDRQSAANTLKAMNLNLFAGPGGTATFSGGIGMSTVNSATGADGEVAVIGGGTVILSGSSTYTNVTTVKGNSTLVLSNWLQSAVLTVQSGSTLRNGGMGEVGGNLVVDGNLKPGGSIGTLTVNGDATLNSTSEFEVELSLTDNTSDLLYGYMGVTVGGTLKLIGGKMNTTYTFVQIDDPTFYELGGTFATVNVDDLTANGLALETGKGYEDGIKYDSEGGTISLTVIPEPASVLLLASGILAAYKLRRRA
jgi:hypothetical protein